MGEVFKLSGRRPDERLLTCNEFAEVLGVGVSTVRRWRREGMPVESDNWAIRVVRIKPSEAKRWLDARKSA